MLIPILRTDNHYDYVKHSSLDGLIESKAIVKFKRNTGWVTIGTDRIREIKRSSDGTGSDRRAGNNQYVP